MLYKYIRRLKYYIIRTLRMQNSDHRIALGFAVGFFPCWYPTFGIDLLLAPLLARMVRASVPSAFLAASAGTVLWPILFYTNYRIGVFVHLFTTFPKTFEIEDALSAPVPETDYRIETNHFGRLGDMGVNFFVGALINSILSTLILYILLRILLFVYRRPMLHKIKESIRRRKSKSK
ncbi:DUF2062 domain-containing protein [Paenibacillus lautus]|uniref:DUF2062 domain-containing protein n=1 Tax=Paenibacillus lautus TaxID=1401 RepID=UPI003D2A78A7